MSITDAFMVAERSPFDPLAPCQRRVPPATRAASGQPAFADMLGDIGLAPATRSAMKLGDKDASMGAVMIFPDKTVPAS